MAATVMGRKGGVSIINSPDYHRRVTVKKQGFQTWKKTILIICVIIYLTYVASYYQSHHITISTDYDYHDIPPILGDESSTQQPNNILTIVGMSYRDNTTSDMAINFLVEAACNYGIPSYILLSERDGELSLDKKITALAHHYGQSLDNIVDYPKCMKLINVSLSPGDEEIYKITQQSYTNNKSLLIETKQQLINNPLDKNNRIARIKRSREYQRQQMYNILKSSHINNDDADWKRNSAIVVLDLDLLAYPSPSDLIETARKYIVTPSSSSYQAICANGLMTVFSKSKQRWVSRYYDTYSTILLPNAWLHRDRISSIKRETTLDNNEHDINEKLSSMDQMEAVQYFIEQGRTRDDSTTYHYKPVPVRSCFNGLTIYRTDVYLNSEECRYDSYNKADEVYASNHYNHACEHVVLHECLRRQMMKSSSNEEFSIAVLPNMKTLWHGI